MKGFIKFMNDYLLPSLARLGEQKHLRGVRNGVIATIPFTIAGSLFLIISFLPIPGWDALVAPYQAQLLVPVTVTFGALSIIATLGIGYNLAKEFHQDAITGALMSLVGFFMLQIETTGFTLSTAKFGAEGLFTAIIVAIFSIEVQKFFVNRNIVIKLPENVPPAVSRSFIALIPLSVIVLALWVLRVVLNVDVNAVITMIFQPAVFALNTLPGILVYMLLICLLWTVGIHGDSVMNSIGTPIMLQFLAANVAAYTAGQPIPYITADGFIPLFVNIGGTGATLALVILMLRSKNAGYKQLGRVALPSGIFEINEPITFGFPIVFNPVMMIPYIVTPMILVIGTYGLMAWDIIGKPVIAVPWTMPPIIGPYLITGGDWKAALWNGISIVIATAVYYPFFKASEKEQLLSLENEQLADNQNVSCN